MAKKFEHGFGKSLAAVADDKTPYLGDVKVVEQMVRNEVSKCFAAIGTSAASDVAFASGNRVANIVLGKDPGWTKIDSWNKPGAVDVFVAKEYNCPTPTPPRPAR